MFYLSLPHDLLTSWIVLTGLRRIPESLLSVLSRLCLTFLGSAGLARLASAYLFWQMDNLFDKTQKATHGKLLKENIVMVGSK